MTIHRRPHGQYARNTPDWFSGRMMAGGWESAADTTHFSIVALYNDATDGSVLHVWAVHCFVQTATAYATVKLFFGTQGTLQTGTPAATNPHNPQLAGAIYGGIVPAAIGTLIYEMGGGQNPTDWPGVFPFCFLVPGYSVCLVTSAVNTAINGAFMWAVMGKNEGYY
jgi:hypothetical protein